MCAMYDSYLPGTSASPWLVVALMAGVFFVACVAALHWVLQSEAENAVHRRTATTALVVGWLATMLGTFAVLQVLNPPLHHPDYVALIETDFDIEVTNLETSADFTPNDGLTTPASFVGTEPDGTARNCQLDVDHDFALVAVRCTTYELIRPSED